MKQQRSARKHDHPYAWLVLLASFCIQFITFAYALAFSVYFTELHRFYDCSLADVALVGSLCYGFTVLLGPMSSIAYQKFGPRLPLCCGGLLATCGMLLSAFSSSIRFMQVSYGVCVGFGLGFTYIPSLVIQTEYFDRFRPFALAFVSVGSATGTLVMPLVFRKLIELYAWRGSMLINAGVCLQIVVCGMLIRPRSGKTSNTLRKKTLCNFTVLKNPVHCLLLTSCFMWSGAVFIVFSMTQKFASTAFPESDTSCLPSLVGVGSVIGRITGSLIAQCTTPLYRGLIYFVCNLLFGASALIIAFSPTFVCLVTGTVFAGAFYGLFLVQLAPVYLHLFGQDLLPSVTSHQMVAVGLGGIFTPHISGLVAESYGLQYAFILSSVVACLSAGAFGLTAIFKKTN